MKGITGFIKIFFIEAFSEEIFYLTMECPYKKATVTILGVLWFIAFGDGI